jgi:hypothetical protein
MNFRDYLKTGEEPAESKEEEPKKEEEQVQEKEPAGDNAGE